MSGLNQSIRMVGRCRVRVESFAVAAREVPCERCRRAPAASELELLVHEHAIASCSCATGRSVTLLLRFATSRNLLTVGKRDCVSARLASTACTPATWAARTKLRAACSELEPRPRAHAELRSQRCVLHLPSLAAPAHRGGARRGGVAQLGDRGTAWLGAPPAFPARRPFVLRARGELRGTASAASCQCQCDCC